MRKFFMWAMTATLCLVGAVRAELKLGDPAPKLDVGEWVKGEPVTELQAGTIYVVEFWATWCIPCVKAIPHLTELQKANPDVVFLGVNIWEDDESKVKPFVEKMGEKMGYRVVMDNKKTDEEGAMATTWMRAAGRNGIPSSFIIDKAGKIAWIGHPMQLDDVLAKVKAGTYDSTSEAKKQASEMAMQQELQTKLMPMMMSEDYDGALKALGELEAKYPDQIETIERIRISVLLGKGDLPAVYTALDKIAADAKDSGELHELAWIVLTAPPFEPQRDLDRAASWATRSCEMTEWKDGEVIDTLARAHAMKGDFDKAIELQTKAVACATGQLAEDLAKNLEAYKARQIPAIQ